MTDEELYQEENRQALIDLNTNLKIFGVELKTFNENYKPPLDNVTVSGKVDVNTEKSVEINNWQEFTDKFNEFTATISTAIAEHSYKPREAVKISNIDEITPKSIEINNLSDLTAYFDTLGEMIKNNQPIVNVTKQNIVFPTSAKNPIAVRLSNGKEFYEAIMGAMAGGGISNLAQQNLEALKFTETGELKTTANIDMDSEGIATEATLLKTVGFGAKDNLTITDVDDGTTEVITITNGVLTKTITITASTGAISIGWS
jgi:hypothetical protein